MQSTSEYLARAEAYRDEAQDIQNWIDCNEADGEEVARAIDARDAYEAAAERAEDLAAVQRELDAAKWLALREMAHALLVSDDAAYLDAGRRYYRAEDALDAHGWADGWAERTEAASAARVQA